MATGLYGEMVKKATSTWLLGYTPMRICAYIDALGLAIKREGYKAIGLYGYMVIRCMGTWLYGDMAQG